MSFYRNRFRLERSISPIITLNGVKYSLYYSTDPEIAKKLIHAKRIREKLLAIKRAYITDLVKCQDKKALLRGYREQVENVEGSYTDIVLPTHQVLTLVKLEDLSQKSKCKSRLNTAPTTNPER